MTADPKYFIPAPRRAFPNAHLEKIDAAEYIRMNRLRGLFRKNSRQRTRAPVRNWLVAPQLRKELVDVTSDLPA